MAENKDLEKYAEEKFIVPPYKAADMVKQAAKIVNNLLANGMSFTEPYREARRILEMAITLLEKVSEEEE